MWGKKKGELELLRSCPRRAQSAARDHLCFSYLSVMLAIRRELLLRMYWLFISY
jgi:hypothetical protein